MVHHSASARDGSSLDRMVEFLSTIPAKLFASIRARAPWSRHEDLVVLIDPARGRRSRPVPHQPLRLQPLRRHRGRGRARGGLVATAAPSWSAASSWAGRGRAVPKEERVLAEASAPAATHAGRPVERADGPGRVQAAARFGGVRPASPAGLDHGAAGRERVARRASARARSRSRVRSRRERPGEIAGRRGKAVLVASTWTPLPAGGRATAGPSVRTRLARDPAPEAAGIEPRRPVWLAAWTDEEGARFGTSILGGRAFVGDDLRGLGDRRDAAGAPCARRSRRPASTSTASLRRAASIGRAPTSTSHRQGRTWRRRTTSASSRRSSAWSASGSRSRGDANHAGTTPMEYRRRDALVGAARIAVGLRDEARSRPA